MRKSKNKILVIGSNGYIGRHVCKYLKEAGYDYSAADIQDKSYDNGHEYYRVDVLDKKGMGELLKDFNNVMLFSGMTGTLNGFKDYERFIELNEIGLLNILDALKERGDQCKVLFPSTRLVYKGKKDEYLKEDSEKEFNTIYSVNKFSCESYLQVYNKSYGINYLIIRICVPYGSAFSSSLSYGTLSHFIDQAKNGKEILLFGTGEQKRSLIHVDDLARFIVLAFANSGIVNDVYNLGGPDVLSIKEIAERIGGIFNVKVINTEWSSDQLRMESGDTIFDSSKLLSSLNTSYNYRFDDWVKTLKEIF